MRRKYRDEISCQSVPKQAAWLNGREGMLAFSARERETRIARLRSSRRRAENILCSGPLIDEALAGRPVSTEGMVLGRAEVRYGEDGQPHRRFTPGPAVGLEDFLDEMGAERAMFYPHPRSISAAVIEEVGTRGGGEARVRRRRGAGADTVHETMAC